MPTYTRGGRKLKRYLANAKRTAREKQPVIEAGFLRAHVAQLAARLEFGDPRSNLPERPAFRQARKDAFAAGTRALADGLRTRTREGVFMVDDATARKAAGAMAAAIADSYRTFHGPGLSERQTKRKEGTPGAGRELVGHKGERLIGHISGRVSRR